MTFDTDDRNPETQIRSDLWSTMNMHELLNQQRLVLNRLSTAGNLLTGMYANENMRGLYQALQHASDTLTEMINQAASKKKA